MFNAVTHVHPVGLKNAIEMSNYVQSLDGVEVVSVTFCGTDGPSAQIGWHIFIKFDNRIITEESIKQKAWETFDRK